MGETATTVLLVDDHDLVREGLTSLFALEDDLDVVGQAGTVEEALRRFHELRPDVVTVDLQLPDGTGLEVVRAIRQVCERTGIVVLTMHDGDEQMLGAMNAGASGFVSKAAPARDVIQVSRHAALEPLAFTCANLDVASGRLRDYPAGRLSEREHGVLILLADGLSAAEIAARLELSLSSVKSCIARIYAKLGAGTRSQALVIAMRRGMISIVGERPTEPAGS